MLIEDAGDAIEPDQGERARGGERSLAIVGKQIEIVLVRNQRSRKRCERSAPRNVERPGYVRASEAIGLAHVDDERARESELGERLRWRRRRILALAEHRWTVAIDALHHTEVGRRLDLPLQHAIDERVDVALGERPVGHALVPHRRRRHVAQRLAARAAGSMRWPDLQIVRELANAAERQEELARARLLRAGLVRRALEQIGAPDIADEDEITSENRDRLLGCVERLYHEGDVLGGVAGRVAHGEAHATHIEHVAVVKKLGSVTLRERVAPRGRPLGREQQLRAGARHELP